MTFSIIVPVYNVELYLAECLDSLLNQSYQDYEIICVNDGSTDNSYEILLDYAKKYPQIKIVDNKHNMGLSFSRNCGVEKATGSHILFVDSDDMLTLDALDILQKNLKYDVDMISFRYLIRNEGKVAIEQNIAQDKQLKFCEATQTGQKWFMERAQEEQIWLAAWSQLYKREFLVQHGLKFYDGILHEDLLYVFQCAMEACRVIYIPQFIYIYRKRDYSITSTFNELRLDSYFVILGEILVRWHLSQKRLEQGMNDAIAGYIDCRFMPVIKKLCALFPKHKRLEIGSPVNQFLFDLYSGEKQNRYYYVQLAESEIAYIKQYSDVIIYGAGVVATELITFLKTHEIEIKAIAVSDKNVNAAQIQNIDISQIEDFTDIRETALVIVAVFLRSQKAISERLESLGFRHIMYIDTEKTARRRKEE